MLAYRISLYAAEKNEILATIIRKGALKVIKFTISKISPSKL